MKYMIRNYMPASNPLLSNLTPGHLILCIDNSSTIDALDGPSKKHRHARRATKRLQCYT
jgi:hypothetical protein